MTSFLTLRNIGETLGRTASTREKAERPTDRVVIQAHEGVLKLIVGDSDKTVIATVGKTTQSGKAIVPARMLLNSIKTLKGKGEADFELNKAGAILTTSLGSSMVMNNMDGDPPVFVRPLPYKADEGTTIKFYEGFMVEAAKYLGMAIGDYSPFNQVTVDTRKDGQVWFKASDNAVGVEIGPLDHAGEPVKTSLPASLFPALRGLEAAGGFYFPIRQEPQSPQVQIGCGIYRVTSVILPGHPALPWVADKRYDVLVSGDKKTFVDTFKAMAGRQQYSKVVLMADDEGFSIVGTQDGSAKLSAETSGKGNIAVNATLIAKALATLSGKTATLEWSNGASLVRITGEAGWPIRLAPMKQI